MTDMMPVIRTREPNIFRYIVAYDHGTAPRPYGGVCTLAICKPTIRKAARVGDWVIGFRSRRPGEVVYAMEVQEVLSLGDYWSDPRFADRRPDATNSPDNIYRPGAHGDLIQVDNAVHGAHDAARDIRGRNVLISKRFWYFGRDSIPIPNQLQHLIHASRGHSVHKRRRPGDMPALEEWLAAWPTGMHGSPMEPFVGQIAEASIGEAPPDREKLYTAKTPAPQTTRRSATTSGARCSRPRQQANALPSTPASPARLVFSRKGFDSGYGGMPSPILPDGRILSLPIPAAHDSVPLGSVGHEDPEKFAALVTDLSSGRHSVDTRVHLDPDLDPMARPRAPGWRPALGQTGAAHTHLAGQGVGPGDVFLFFGWFRQVEREAGKWRYVPRAPQMHLLFGWLEVADVLPIVAQREDVLRRYPWAATHAHAENPAHYTSAQPSLYRPRAVAFHSGRTRGRVLREILARTPAHGA